MTPPGSEGRLRRQGAASLLKNIALVGRPGRTPKPGRRGDELLTRKGPALRPGLVGSVQQAPELGDAAGLIGALVRLRLNDPGRLIGDAHHQLRHAAVGFDDLL